MFSIILLHSLWGASLPIVKYLLSFSPPMLLAGTRMCIAGLLLLIINSFILKKNISIKKLFSLNSTHIKNYAQIIFFSKYLRYALKYWSLSSLTAIKTAFIVGSAPFFTALLSYIFLKERITRTQSFALVIGFLGLAPLLLTTSPVEQSIGEFLYISLPECVLILGIISHCYGQIITKQILHTTNHSIVPLSSITSLGGGLLALITAYYFGETLQPDSIAPFATWLMVLVIGSNIICHLFYLHLLKKHSATFLSLAELLSPLFTTLYSWYFLGEAITWHFAVSGFFIASALVLFNQSRKTYYSH